MMTSNRMGAAHPNYNENGLAKDVNEPRKTPLEAVKEFHEHYGMPVGESPKWLDSGRTQLRMELIKEEYKEMLQGYASEDLPNVAKELADMVYVIYGMAVELGIDLDSVFEEVHRSNMSKLGADGKPLYREDGKVLKGPNYSPADVESVW